MPYFSKFYGIEVRDEIVQEWTNDKGEVDDMMAGLHEIRVRHAEGKYDLKRLESKIRAKQPDLVNLMGKK